MTEELSTENSKSNISNAQFNELENKLESKEKEFNE